MAVGTKKSNIITNLDLAKPSLTDHGKQIGGCKISADAFELATEDIGDINDVIELTRLPSHARILSIKIYSDEVDTHASPTLATDCGIYLTDGTVVDVDAFGSAVTTGWGDAPGVGVDFIAEAGAGAVVNIGKRLWEWVGESEDPVIHYDICLRLTAAAATAASGTISFVILYTND